MKAMPVPPILVGALTIVALVSPALSVSIDWVTVGDINNPSDPLTGYGSVGYTYQIGKYEVTNSQYVDFLNAKGGANAYEIYDPAMSNLGIIQSGERGSYSYSATSSLANRPVAFVSWFDAARFANWLNNGQDYGDTETGAYTLNGAMPSYSKPNAGLVAVLGPVPTTSG